MQENRDVAEGRAPFQHGAVIMRVRNRDAAKRAQSGNQFHRRVIDQRDAIPEKISLRRAQQKRSLPDREFRNAADADQPRLVLPKGVVMAAAQLFERRPLLTRSRNELPRITADRAGRRRRGGFRKLGSARFADRFHFRGSLSGDIAESMSTAPSMFGE